MTPNNFRVKSGLIVGTTISGGNTTITGFVNATSSVNAASHTVGSAFIANATGITTTGFANVGTTLAVAGISTFSGNVVLGSVGVSSNGSFGTAGQVLHSNGTATYWATDDGSVTSIATANGLSGGTITTTGTLGVTTGSTLTVNTTGIHVNSALSITSLTLAGAASGITTLASGNTTHTGWANVTGTIQGGSSLAIAGALSGVTTAAMGNTTITGFANVSTTLQVGTNTATFGTAAYILANGDIGIGTASPVAKLDVRGNLAVGGADAGPNFIAFRGTTADGPGSYEHTFIGERIHTATESSELFLFKGNDPSASGPDRVRIGASEFRVDTYATALNGPFETVANSANLTTHFIVTNGGNVGIGNTAPGSKLVVAGAVALGNTTVTGFANVTSTIQGGSSLTIAGALSGVTTAAMGNTTITGFANVTSTLQVGGISTFSGNVVLGSVGVSANGSFGTAGHVLHTNGTATYWAVDDNTTYDLVAVANTAVNAGLLRLTDSSSSNDTVTFTGAGTSNVSSNATHIIINSADQYLGTVTSVGSGNGLTGGAITTTGTLSVVANSGLIANATGVFVNANTELSANSTGVFHVDIARSNTTTGNTSPNYGGTFTAVDSITTNARGHVTAVNTKTVTMPASNNTTYDLLAVANTAVNAGLLRLQDSSSSNDTVTFTGTGTSNVSSNATHIIINSADQYLGTVTSIVAANGLNGGTITSTGTMSVLGGSTLTVNSTGAHVNSALSIASLALSGDLTVSGNLTVSGTRTYVNTTTLDVGDNIFTLNADLGAVAPSQDAGIEIMRGTSANVQFLWDETNDRWSTNGQPMAVSSLVAAGAASGITTLAAGNITITGFANVTSTIQGGSSLTIAGAASGITTLASGNTTHTGWANVTGTIQGGSSLTIAGALSGVTTAAMGNTTITGFANVTSTIQGGSSLVIAGALSGVTTAAMGNTTITGFANVSTTLQVGGVATFAANANFDSGAFFVDGVNNRVGVNTTAPQSRMQIFGSNAPETGDAASTETMLTLTRDGSASVWREGASFALGRWQTGGGSNPFSRLDINLKTVTDNSSLPNVTVMTLLDNGNVGIGNTVPGSRLVVGGTSGPVTTPTALELDNSYSSTAGFDKLKLYLLKTGSETYGFGLGANADVQYWAGSSSTGIHRFYTSQTERAQIAANGNFGIGTTTPANKLHIAGTAGTLLRLDGGAGGTGTRDIFISEFDTAAYGGIIRYDSGADTFTFGTVENSTVVNAINVLRASGNVGIGTTTPGYKLEVNGSFAATTKSFVIDHPTKPGMKLRYGSLEGPENGVYVRGRLRAGEKIIQLPDYWEGLVDEDTYTVNLTPVGKHQELYVEHIASDYIIVGGENIDCFYTVFAERNDVEKLVVEF